MHSRNFNLQKAGNADWIIKNYNFEKISRYIDEIIFLDVSREPYDRNQVFADFKKVTNNCFVPKSFGGKLRKKEDIEMCFENGADKVVVNSIMHLDPQLIVESSRIYGSQSIIGSIDVKLIQDKYNVFIENGSKNIKTCLKKFLNKKHIKYIGEIYLNSMDKDGTGQGFDINLLKITEANVNCPIILAGGAGKASHFYEALSQTRVDALATANLFNFIGSGLEDTRNNLLKNNFLFPQWDPNFLKSIQFKYDDYF